MVRGRRLHRPTGQRATPEKVVQQHVVRLLETVGSHVYVLGTRRSRGQRCPACKEFVPNTDHSTHQTPGISDVYAMVPDPEMDGQRRPMWVECKAEGGRPSPAQVRFAEQCRAAGIWHVTGDLDDVIAFLLDKQVLKRWQVAHYRLPALPAEGNN